METTNQNQNQNQFNQTRFYTEKKGVKAFITSQAEYDILVKYGQNVKDSQKVETSSKPSRAETYVLALIANEGKTMTIEAWWDILGRQSCDEPANAGQNIFIGTIVRKAINQFCKSKGIVFNFPILPDAKELREKETAVLTAKLIKPTIEPAIEPAIEPTIEPAPKVKK